MPQSRKLRRSAALGPGFTLCLPEKLQRKLHLACGGCGAGDGAGSAGEARARGGGRSEHDEVGRIEIGAIKEVEEFGAELEAHAFANRRVFQDGKIPGGQAGADVGVAADVAEETAGGWRADECIGIEPLTRLAEDDGAGECWIQEGTHRITSVAIVGGVVAQLWRERESGLRRDDAGERPAADGSVAPCS